MILTGSKIEQEFKNGNLEISPFSDTHISTNSYDICLSDTLIRYTDEIIDPKKPSNYEQIKIPNEGMILKRNNFYLGSSVEIIGSNNYVPIVHAKSGIARLGLFVHVTADLIDIGSVGNITFQLFPVNSIKVYPNMKIGQITFWKPTGKIKLYNGKYQNSSGPSVSKTYLDFQNTSSF